MGKTSCCDWFRFACTFLSAGGQTEMDMLFVLNNVFIEQSAFIWGFLHISNHQEC